MGHQRIARKVHLGYQAARERWPEQREVDVRWAPRVLVVAPWVSAGLHGDESVAALTIGETASGACEVRVERRRVIVDRVDVAPSGVGLPCLDQRVAHWMPVAVHDLAGDDNPLAERLAVVLARQVGILRPHLNAPEGRSGKVVEPFRRKPDQPAARRAPDRRAVIRVQVRRFEVAVGVRHP